MKGMFMNCKHLKNLDLSNLKTEKATNMSSIFYGCEYEKYKFISF